MDKCTDCLCTLTLPACFDTLVVGTVGSPNTNYYVYIYDTTVKKLTGYEATSSSTGVISISLTSVFAQNHTYELWATLRTSTPEEREDILISGATYPHSCFDLTFQTIKTATFTSQLPVLSLKTFPGLFSFNEGVMLPSNIHLLELSVKLSL